MTTAKVFYYRLVWRLVWHLTTPATSCQRLIAFRGPIEYFAGVFAFLRFPGHGGQVHVVLCLALYVSRNGIRQAHARRKVKRWFLDDKPEEKEAKIRNRFRRANWVWQVVEKAKQITTAFEPSQVGCWRLYQVTAFFGICALDCMRDTANGPEFGFKYDETHGVFFQIAEVVQGLRRDTGSV